MAKCPNKCRQQGYLINIILDCGFLILPEPAVSHIQVHNVIGIHMSHHSGGSHGNRLAPARLQLILLIEEQSKSARCLYHFKLTGMELLLPGKVCLRVSNSLRLLLIKDVLCWADKGLWELSDSVLSSYQDTEKLKKIFGFEYQASCYIFMHSNCYTVSAVAGFQ